MLFLTTIYKTSINICVRRAIDIFDYNCYTFLMSQTFLLLVSLATLVTLLHTSPSVALAAEPPYLMMHNDIYENASLPRFLDNLALKNPFYIFSNPFRETGILTPPKIQELHTRLPQAKVILHLLCCTL